MAWGRGLLKEATIKFDQWTDIEIGYLAGIVDGEGCLNIYRTKAHTQCRLTINTTDKILGDWLKEKIGTGGVNKERRIKPRPHHKQVYIYLMAAQKDLLNLLLWITPHLLIKKKRAQECIDFLEWKIMQNTNFKNSQ